MESIFIFIIIAILSSLFNKDKHAKKAHRRTGNLENKSTEAGRDQTFEKPKTVRPVQRGSLGDLIKELKTDFDDVFQENPSGQKKTEDYRSYIEEEEGSYHVDYDYKGYEHLNNDQQEVDTKRQESRYTLGKAKTQKKTIVSRKDSDVNTVYEDEIRDEAVNFSISFDEETLLQGIIMSEILGKPKALRR